MNDAYARRNSVLIYCFKKHLKFSLFFLFMILNEQQNTKNCRLKPAPRKRCKQSSNSIVLIL